MQTQTYKTSSNFPAELYESINIVDGRGRKVEEWEVKKVIRGKDNAFITLNQRGYRSVGDL